jgi:hypothetical protein
MSLLGVFNRRAAHSARASLNTPILMAHNLCRRGLKVTQDVYQRTMSAAITLKDVPTGLAVGFVEVECLRALDCLGI